MTERRQAHRREPIVVVVRDREFEAHPLPWMKRNDLGNEIMRQYSELLNSSMRAYTSEDTSPQLELYLNDKVQDPIQLIKLGYPSWRDEDFLNDLDYDELLELIFASLEVNRLESLRDLVDPNSNTPTNSGGTSSPGEVPSDILSKLSSPDSSSQDSLEKKSSTSRTKKSSPSKKNQTDSSGTTAGGASL